MASSKEESLNHSRLLEVLRYDPEGGKFYWRVKHYAKRWPVAGTIKKNKFGGPRLRVRLDGKCYLTARLAWFYMTSRWPAAEIDHKNLNGLDDRWCNLREATSSQNCANRISARGEFKGVLRHKNGRYRATVYVNGKSIHLGYFEKAEEAKAAYQKAAVFYFGEYARLTA